MRGPTRLFIPRRQAAFRSRNGYPVQTPIQLTSGVAKARLIPQQMAPCGSHRFAVCQIVAQICCWYTNGLDVEPTMIQLRWTGTKDWQTCGWKNRKTPALLIESVLLLKSTRSLQVSNSSSTIKPKGVLCSLVTPYMHGPGIRLLTFPGFNSADAWVANVEKECTKPVMPLCIRRAVLHKSDTRFLSLQE